MASADAAAATAGRTTLIGVGSLMSEASARSSFALTDFRGGEVAGWERVFNLVSMTNIKRGATNFDTCEMSSLAARPIPAARAASAQRMRVSLFEIPDSDLPEFYRRENRYQHKMVPYVDDNGGEGLGLLCVQNTDAGYKSVACKGDAAVYHDIVGQHWGGRLWYNWADDEGAVAPADLKPARIFPVRYYLKLCRGGAASMSREAHENFMDTTFVYDGRSLREYCGDEAEVEAETKPEEAEASL